MLCRAGADVNARSASGLALFYRLIVEGVEMSWCNITQVHYIFPALYEFGCDINAESGPNNNTALMEAMARNKIECAQALMMLGM
jgi:ankyrin repeat protein